MNADLKVDSLVSIVIPTMNSASLLPECLDSIKHQTWRSIETIIVDGFSTDETVKVTERYGTKVFSYGPRQSAPFQKVFGAPFQWNYGANHVKGSYIYLVDSDMRLSPSVVEDCVNLVEGQGYDAVIIPEISYGEGLWAECKSLQRSFFIGDNSMESPRFLKVSVWKLLNGLDPKMGGYLDWDLSNRLRERKFKIGRINSAVYHYEGRLRLAKLMRKKYIHGKMTSAYFAKQKGKLFTSETLSRFSLIRRSYIKNFRGLLANPQVGLGLIVMILSEYVAAIIGVISGIGSNHREPERYE